MVANMLDIVQVILYIEFLVFKIFSQQGTGFCVSFIHKDHPVGRILFYATIYLCPRPGFSELLTLSACLGLHPRWYKRLAPPTLSSGVLTFLQRSASGGSGGHLAPVLLVLRVVGANLTI
jgi:hypothetical protein